MTLTAQCFCFSRFLFIIEKLLFSFVISFSLPLRFQWWNVKHRDLPLLLSLRENRKNDFSCLVLRTRPKYGDFYRIFLTTDKFESE